ncbi:MAG: ComEC family competence protein [Alphaproteobacteria bacterium]|nr:ComEC family competence protein [Alphaproteobacteria bacterium]
MLTRKELLAQILMDWRADEGRGLLTPLWFIAGIALYFALPSEPDYAPYFLLVAAIAWFFTKRLRSASYAFLLLMIGLSWATFYTAHIEHRMLERAITPRPVTGVIDEIEPTAKGIRITLSQVTIAGFNPEQTPRRIRVAMRGELPELMIGDGVKLNAGMLPPMGPAMPHSFDFARYFFFRDIGAVGYGLNPITVTKHATDGEGWSAMWARWRHALTQNIMHTLPSPHNGIAAGLITGEDAAIPPEVHDQLWAANLLHVIAISGAHMVVISGIAFIGLRLLFLAIPTFGQRPIAKQIAAAFTLIALTAYLLITGMMLSATRAYIMMAFVLGAVMLARNVQPMRSLILAAVLMLIIDPSDLLEPGFQLSFAATMAIIAFVFSRDLAEQTTWRTPLKYLGWLLMVSVVAEASTAPLVIHQFNTLSPYGVLANTILSPVVAIIIMPMVALYFLLLPIGLESIALHVMWVGIEAMLRVAANVSELPHALIFIKAIPNWGAALFAFGLAWLCILSTRMRYTGIIVMVLGIASISTVRLPDMLIASGLNQIALRSEGAYHLVRGRAESLVPELWANGTATGQTLPYTPKLAPDWRCDKLGCVAFERIALPYSDLALLNDCNASDVIFMKYGAKCLNDTRIIETYKMNGTIGIWLGDELRIETSRDWQGNRPWSD